MAKYMDFDSFNSFFSYNSETGEIKRKIKINQYVKGFVVGCKHVCGAKTSKKMY